MGSRLRETLPQEKMKATEEITDVNLRLPHMLVHLHTCAYIHTNRHAHVHTSHTH